MKETAKMKAISRRHAIVTKRYQRTGQIRDAAEIGRLNDMYIAAREEARMRDTRYKMPKERRKIGGKIYLYLEWRKLKSEAESAANRLRNRGKSVRVIRALKTTTSLGGMRG